MTIKFRCSNCDRLIQTPDSAAGKQGKCPHCDTHMAIPAASGASDAAAPPHEAAAAPDAAATPGDHSGGSIEFHCDHCQRQLRVPAASAGKRAKCPQCGTVVQIPIASPSVEPSPPILSAPPSQTGPDLATESANPFGLDEAAASDNPYAAPSATATIPAPSGAGAPGGKLDFSDTLQSTWQIYRDNLGTCVVMSLVVIGLVIVAYVALIALVIAVFAMSGAAVQAGGAGNLTAAMVAIMILSYLVFFIAAAWLQAGMAHMMVRIARGKPNTGVRDMFGGGPFMLRVLGFNFILVLIIIPVAIGAAMLTMLVQQEAASLLVNITNSAVQYLLMLFFGLTPYIIVDQQTGLFESMSLSMKYMRGNKLTVFALHLVVGIGCAVVTLVTCGIGYLFALPFLLLLLAVIYVKASGQATAGQLRQG